MSVLTLNYAETTTSPRLVGEITTTPMQAPRPLFVSSSSTQGPQLTLSSSFVLTELSLPFSIYQNPSWLPIFEDIRELAALEENWNGEGEVSPSGVAVAAASYLIEAAREIKPFAPSLIPVAAAPMPNGGIEILWKSPAAKLFVQVEPDGTFGYSARFGAGENAAYEARTTISEGELLSIIASRLKF